MNSTNPEEQITFHNAVLAFQLPCNLKTREYSPVLGVFRSKLDDSGPGISSCVVRDERAWNYSQQLVDGLKFVYAGE